MQLQQVEEILRQSELLMDVHGTADSREFQQITHDSRETEKASGSVLFFARKGAGRDGHDFLKDLAKSGSILAFVAEKMPEGFQLANGRAIFLVRDSTLAMALIAKKFYGDPSSQAFTFAVTGTNGKTTTSYLVESLLAASKKRPGRIGTIEIHFENYAVESSLTTPDFTKLQEIFSDLKKRGAESFVFEASSHALDQRRLLGIDLDAALFTNLTPEHLDYHRTMENYYSSKRRLFMELLLSSSKKEKYAVLPEDGAYGTRLIDELYDHPELHLLTWGYQKATRKSTQTSKMREHFHLQSYESSLSGSEFRIAGYSEVFKSKLVGKHNVENVIGALAIAKALGLALEKASQILEDAPYVPGRLEKVASPRGFVFVDYAHTPDALENVLQTLRPLTKGKLKVVFGCGGDRDRTKRPKMGALAELYADEVYVTSDNPRTEDPEAIVGEILAGIQRIKPVHIEVDRKKAIEKSLVGLKAEDVVLIAGKGHETYQILGTTKIHFDDREIAKAAPF